MTPLQKRAYDFIRSYIHEHGTPPTLREIGEGIGVVSKGNMHRVVTGLVERGLITRTVGRSRSIVLRSTISAELPPALFAAVQSAAFRSMRTPEQVVIDAVRDGLPGYRSREVVVSRETHGEAA